MLKPRRVNSFSFRCAICGSRIAAVHIIVRVLAQFGGHAQHLCSFQCAQRWFGTAP
jgi:hypothetical protein